MVKMDNNGPSTSQSQGVSTRPSGKAEIHSLFPLPAHRSLILFTFLLVLDSEKRPFTALEGLGSSRWILMSLRSDSTLATGITLVSPQYKPGAFLLLTRYPTFSLATGRTASIEERQPTSRKNIVGLPLQ